MYMYVPEDAQHEDAWIEERNGRREVAIRYPDGRRERVSKVTVVTEITDDPEDVRWEIQRIDTGEVIAFGLCESYGRTVPEIAGSSPAGGRSGAEIFAEQAEGGTMTFG